MNKDEEYVRSVWRNVREYADRTSCAVVILTGSDAEDVYSSDFERTTKESAWSAAAEFTRERMEQVRQLREAQNKFRFMCSALAPEEWATMEPVDKLAKAELTRLTAGMKPEAL